MLVQRKLHIKQLLHLNTQAHKCQKSCILLYEFHSKSWLVNICLFKLLLRVVHMVILNCVSNCTFQRLAVFTRLTSIELELIQLNNINSFLVSELFIEYNVLKSMRLSFKTILKVQNASQMSFTSIKGIYLTVKLK